MIVNAKTETENLSGIRKAAMLIVVLGEQSSADILKELEEEEVQLVSREVARLTSITPEQAEGLLNEFHQLVMAGDYVARGGIDFARKLLTRAFPPEVAKRMLYRLT